VESPNDIRFDPNYAVQMFLDAVHERSTDILLSKLAARTVARPDVACVRCWLVDKTTGCLRFAVADGNLPPEGSQIDADVGVVGQVAATGIQAVRRRSDADFETLADPAWISREDVQAIIVTPFIFKDEVLGVFAMFLRHERVEESLPYGQIFGHYIGAAIANARAFEEIRQLTAQLELQNTYLQEAVIEAKAFGDLVGQSAALRHIIQQVDLVAPTEASVLILGETGTGKELVAHEIHRRSRRQDGPLVRVNCASIPRDLFESEFFGHVRGSFTGAVKDRPGRFETAEGGTILLDEVGEIPLDVQNKLLRVLQEKRYERIGEDRTRCADVRIIAATNRDLKQAVAVGKFREDLYYRLNVFPINVPPLRERLDDIPALAQHFSEISARDLKCARPRLTRAGVIRLQSYDWPGNVRELRNVIERAVILARGGALDFDLPAANQTVLPHRGTTPPDGPAAPAFLTEAEMQRRVRDNLIAVLEKVNWKIKGPDGAAELLGVNPTTLLSRMNKWGLKKPGAP